MGAVWARLRASYWFIPLVMSAGAIGLAFLLVWGDVSWARDWLSSVPWLVSARAEGARSLLSTIAGSMITVAGVTFSITIAAVAYVSSQLGPRVLDTFMRDTGNQVTLGTFIATFIYCILVLRNIRSPDATGDAGFVPQVAVLAGFVLSLVSVAVLIFFIHHVPTSIHASHVVAAIGEDLVHQVEVVFPEPAEEAGDAPPPTPPLPDDLDTASVAVRAEGDGYVTQVDYGHLMELAVDEDLILEVVPRIGTFVRKGTELVRVYPGARVHDGLKDRVVSDISLGSRRTQTQDILFLVNELVEIGGRALSPGINDPFTAMTCVDWLGAGLGRAAARTMPTPYRADDQGRLRVLAPSLDFPLLAYEAFSRIRPYVETDRNAALHMMGVLGELAGEARRSQDRRAVVAQADALLEGGLTALPHENDRDELRRRHRAAVSAGARHIVGEAPAEEGPRVDAPTAAD